MEYVIFSIDDVNDTHALAKFLRHIDTARAMDKMQGKMVHCIGSWEGELEPSFLMRWDDFQEHVIGRGFVEDQDAILVVHGDKMQAVLHNKDGSRTFIGRMKETDAATAMQQQGFTYRPDLGKYWIVD